MHLIIDAIGLKVFSEGEWKVRQHGANVDALFPGLDGHLVSSLLGGPTPHKPSPTAGSLPN